MYRSKLTTPETEWFFKAILSLKTEEDCARFFEDVATIMETTNIMSKKCEKPLVSMAMGSIGSITRISGENFGSGITFGTVGAASAPGQFPIGELRSLLEALHKKNEEE